MTGPVVGAPVVGAPVAGATAWRVDDGPVWTAFLSSQWLPAVLVADEVGLFAALAEAPASGPELAGRTGWNPRVLRSLLALLASLGLLTRRGGRFQLSATAAVHLVDGPFGWGGLLAMHRRGDPVAGRLRDVLLAPDPDEAVPSPGDAGMLGDDWAAGAMDRRRADRVVAYMHAHSAAAADDLAAAADLSATRRLLDVGGCSGCFSVALARANPGLRATVVDLPAVCAAAGERIGAAGLADRVGTVALDMFRHPWPAGHDAVLLSNVLHDWRPATCAELLRRAFDAVEPGGTVLVHEMLLDDDLAGPREAAAFGVLMAVGTQGQQLSFAELSGLLQRAGFTAVSCQETGARYSLVRAVRP